MRREEMDQKTKERINLGREDRHIENVMVIVFGVINLVLLTLALSFRW